MSVRGSTMKGMGLMVTALISIIAGSVVGYAFSYGEASELQSQISTLSSSYDDLNSEYDQLEANHTSLQSEASTCRAELNNCAIEYEELSDDYGNLTERYSELNATYGILSDSYSNLNQKFLDLNITCEALSDNYDSLNQSYSDLREAYEQLEERVNCTCILGVYFSPDGECEAKVIEWIGKANNTIHILIYSFSLDSISDALISAKDRGIDVKVVFEEDQIRSYSEYWKLRDAGVSVRNDTNSDYMHHKVMIVDNTVVLTGSFNWSAHAQEDNDENLVMIRDEAVAQSYLAEFTRVWEAACPIC